MSTEGSPDPTAAAMPDAFSGLAALEASITRTNAELERLRADTYQATDAAGLVTAVVDGEGVVVTVTFTKTIARHDPALVEEAVRAAVTAAQRRIADAVAALVAGAPPTRVRQRTKRGDTGEESWREAPAVPGVAAATAGVSGGVLGVENE